jgi:thiol-disulfide isomerase/thioredoxin
MNFNIGNFKLSSISSNKTFMTYGLIVLIFLWASSVNKTESFQNELKPLAPKGGNYEFVMYYADWCPHCQTAKPEFGALGATKTIDGRVVAIRAVNPESAPEAVKTSAGEIGGYPTFHLYDPEGRLLEEYKGERNTAGFLQFLEEKVKA